MNKFVYIKVIIEKESEKEEEEIWWKTVFFHIAQIL